MIGIICLLIKALVAVSAFHDWGKATVLFQEKLQ
jgi:hypothetical protein